MINEKTFITQDKHMIIEFKRSRFKLFDIEDSYNIIFKNNIGKILKEIRVSKIDLSIFLDNLFFFTETLNDAITSFECSTVPLTLTTFRVSLIPNEINILNQYNIVFEYIESINYKSPEQYTNCIFKFNIENNLTDFIDCIYEILYK